MYKFIFTKLIDPLILPIPVFYEYIVLFLVGIVAFRIAWKVSPGGRWGSEIHWIVRLIIFVSLWLLLNTLILIAKWILTNYILILWIVVGIVIIALISYAIIRNNRKA